MDGADFGFLDVLGVLEGEAQDPFTRLSRDELDGLHDAVDDDVLDAGVLALGVLSDEDRVDVVVGCLVARDTLTRPHVGEQVEGAAEGEVEGDVAFADGGCEGSLEGDVVAGYGADGFVGDGLLAVFEDGVDGDGFPLYGSVGSGEDVFDGLGDLNTTLPC